VEGIVADIVGNKKTKQCSPGKLSMHMGINFERRRGTNEILGVGPDCGPHF
jgi:hypothetical protein